MACKIIFHSRDTVHYHVILLYHPLPEEKNVVRGPFPKSIPLALCHVLDCRQLIGRISYWCQIVHLFRQIPHITFNHGMEATRIYEIQQK